MSLVCRNSSHFASYKKFTTSRCLELSNEHSRMCAQLVWQMQFFCNHVWKFKEKKIFLFDQWSSTNFKFSHTKNRNHVVGDEHENCTCFKLKIKFISVKIKTSEFVCVCSAACRWPEFSFIAHLFYFTSPARHSITFLCAPLIACLVSL